MRELVIRSIGKFGIVLLMMTLFGGCKPLFDLFRKKKVEKEITKKEEPQGEILLKVDGEVAHESDFNEYLAQMLQMNPYFRGATVESLPTQLKEKFFDEYKRRMEILAHQKSKSVDQESDFVADYEKMCGLVKDSLLIQRFEKDVYEKIAVDDSEVKDYFENNKAGKFKKEEESVSVSAFKFKDSKKADEFYDQVKGKTKDAFEKLAETEKDGEFKDFGRVGIEKRALGLNAIPKAIRDEAFKLKKFPAIEKIKVGKNVWVAHFSDKKETEYFTLDEVRPQIEAMLRRNKFRDELVKQIGEIEKDLKVYVNTAYFKKEEKPILPPGVKIKTKEEVEKEKKEAEKNKEEAAAVAA